MTPAAAHGYQQYSNGYYYQNQPNNATQTQQPAQQSAPHLPPPPPPPQQTPPPPPPQPQQQQQQQTAYYPPVSQQYPQYQYSQPAQYYRPPPPARPPPPPPPIIQPNPPKVPVITGKTAPIVPPWSKKKVETPLPPQQQKPVATIAALKNTTPKNAKSSEANAGDVAPAEAWPASLKQYVQDVFTNCLPGKRDEAEMQLRNLITEGHKAGTLLTTDWSEVDLPSACLPSKKKKKSQQNTKKKPVISAHVLNDEEEAKRLRRLRRFEEDAAQHKSENMAAAMQQVQLEGPIVSDTVIGTSTKLEKQYLRLTSAPDPTTVRPLFILKQTLELLREKWKKEQNYTYICDQFKSMRQDLTVQRIKDAFTVQVYEIHARIALEKSDLGEYNQCQTQLKGLYMSGIPGNMMEFTAYRILYFLHTQNASDINSTMAELTDNQKQNPFVEHALQVRSSLAISNYHRFFYLYKTAPNMGGYLMDQFIERERVHSLLILCKACRPDVSLQFIQNELGLDSREELTKFLTEQKAMFLKSDNPELLDCKAAYGCLTENLKKYKTVDIKGQVY
ncbi:SAC3/GANP/Nin1/mts3/eIF-3 p25 family-domain-containing protein [Sporodiniella umbellata]|nr:SAC3/GANP/Nin1/mts3/eIF-3 p25 family-domain-containing protein [Sporodiniella umbellata]